MRAEPTIKHSYGQDDDYQLNDPGNVLRRHLTEIDAPNVIPELETILYTGEERGILPFRLLPKDALTIWRMVEVARTASTANLKRMRL